jgi:hypothetical protein
MTDAERADKLAQILRHAYPERSGSFFISGAGPIGDDGLPETVSICPAFGADWSVIYRRTDKGVRPEW